MIEIHPSGDLVLIVFEKIKNKSGEHLYSETEAFRVRRQVMRQASSFWSEMYNPNGPYREGAKDVVEFGEVPILSFEILLRNLHNNPKHSHAYDASILNVWQLLDLMNKWELKTDVLKPGFAIWYSAQGFDKKELDILEQRRLLFPCYYFDHAEGFARATRFLAYRVSGHIQEDNPIEHDKLHLPVFTTRLLNSARFRLGLILSRDLHKINRALLKATCRCRGETLWGYEKALESTGIWPFEETVSHNSVDALLHKLEKFDYVLADKRACLKYCRRNYNEIAQQARQRTERYFDGLCLDCMSRTKPKLKDHHADFWKHNNFRAEDGWFKGCRIKHKQPSWYYSFMGREEDKNFLLGKDRFKYDGFLDDF